MVKIIQLTFSGWSFKQTVLLVTALFRSILRLAQSCFKSYSLILTHPVNDNVKSHKEYYLNALSF